MATLASTHVSTAVVSGGPLPITFMEDGLIVEVWRVPGGAANDTCAITPAFSNNIRALVTNLNAGHNLTTSANTNVTLTLGTGANASTSVAYDVWLICART